MRVGLNLLHCHSSIGGVWNYVRNLLEAIRDYSHANEYYAFVTVYSEQLVPAGRNWVPVKVRISGRQRLLRVMYENLILGWHAERLGLSCMHWFANTVGFMPRVPALVTMHDLNVFDLPPDFSRAGAARWYLRIMMPRSAARAAIVLPVSEATAARLTAVLQVPRCKMVVVPSPIGEAFRPVGQCEVERFRAKYALPDRFWLYVSHYYPHKNHAALFRAYGQLVRRAAGGKWPLVLCGNRRGADSLMCEMAREAGVSEKIVWLPLLPDEEMPSLYSAATSLVFPSLYEGGGIPVMEALACGCPVIASNIPAVQEFAGEAAMMVEPSDCEGLANAMDRMASHEILQESYRQAGLARSVSFRSPAIAKRILDAYQKAAARPCGGRKRNGQSPGDDR